MAWGTECIQVTVWDMEVILVMAWAMGWDLEGTLAMAWAMAVIMDMVAILSTTIMDSIIIITDSITGAVVNKLIFYLNQIHEKSILGSTFFNV